MTSARRVSEIECVQRRFDSSRPASLFVDGDVSRRRSSVVIATFLGHQRRYRSFTSFLSDVDKAKTIVLGPHEDGMRDGGRTIAFRKCESARADLGLLLASWLGMPGEKDFNLARLARLEAMLHDLIGEHATTEGERAEHLADAIRDLQTLINQLRGEQPPQRHMH
jgi:hypothetical protein